MSTLPLDPDSPEHGGDGAQPGGGQGPDAHGGAHDPSTIATRAELGARLTSLRADSGRSLRDLAAAIGSSASTLSGWCRAENLPYPAQYDVFRAMLAELGVTDPEPWLTVLDRIRESVAATSEGTPPYRGLQPFDTDHAASFVGREALIEQTDARLASIVADRSRADLLVVVGSSGSGKSSLLRAGLVPRWHAAGMTPVVCTPGADPLVRLADALHAAGLHDAPPASPGSGDARSAADGPPRGSSPAIVVVDQAEELFAPGIDPGVRDEFLTTVEACTRPTAAPHAVVVLVLRLDYYPRLVLTGRCTQALPDGQVLVGPLDRDGLRRAIVEPARQAGVAVDDALVELLLRDFAPTPGAAAGALPLLSHALLETWKRARRGRMTLADYQQTGGVEGAVEQSAEACYAACTPRQRDLLPAVMLRLVHVGHRELATRRSAPRSELLGLGDEVEAILDRFVTARLLTTSEHEVEISHEALLTAWPRLRQWIEDGRDALDVHRRLAEATRAWLASGRDPSALARGVTLESFTQADEVGAAVVQRTADERAFLTASLAQEQAAQRAERAQVRRLRTLATVASVVGLLAVVLAVAAVQARADALLARDEALSRQLAVTAGRLAESDPGLAAQLAVAGYSTAPTTEARGALLDLAAGPRSARWLGGPGSTPLVAAPDASLVAFGDAASGHVHVLHDAGAGLTAAATVPLSDDDLESYALALSPDSLLLAVGDTAPAISLIDLTDPTDPVRHGEVLRGPEGPIQHLAFSPDGAELIAVGLGDGAFRWDVTDPGDPQSLVTIPSEEITWSVDYAPDGQVVAVGQDDGRLQLWERGDEPRLLSDTTIAESAVLSVAYAPDGTQVLTGTRQGLAVLLDVTDATSPAVLALEEVSFASWVNAVAFSADGELLAAGSSDTTLRLWSADSLEPLTSLAHPAAVTGVALTAEAVLTGAADGTARRWERATSLPLDTQGRTWGLAFDPEQPRLAAFAGGQTSLWELPSPPGQPRLLARFAANDELVFSGGGGGSPDGRQLALGTLTGEVAVYDVSDPASPVLQAPVLGGSQDLVESVAFSADGALLLAGGSDTAVRVWQLDGQVDAEPTVVLDDPTEIVLSVVTSPQGRLVAAASADNRVYLYDLAEVASPQLLAVLDGLDSEAFAAAFTPDVGVLAIAGSDATVLLWDLSDPSAPVRLGAPLTGPSGRIFDLDIASDGSLLAAAVVDGSVWVWDLTDPAMPRVLAELGPAPEPRYTVGFFPDGQRLAAAGADGRLVVWELDPIRAIDAICASAGEALTAEEWQRLVPERPYTPPCPPP